MDLAQILAIVGIVAAGFNSPSSAVATFSKVGSSVAVFSNFDV